MDLRFRIGGPISDSMTAFVDENAARLFAVSESDTREDSVIDIAGTDFEREMLSMISENTELPNISPISIFESSGSNSEELLINANFANVPKNSYGRPVLAVPPSRAERLTRQIPQQPNSNTSTTILLLPFGEMVRLDPYPLHLW